MRAGSAAGGRGVGAGTRGGVKPGPLPPRAPMYAFYSLLIYIFYSLFRRDGGAAAAADAENPAQSARCKPGSRRRAYQPSAELWTELTGLVGTYCWCIGNAAERYREGPGRRRLVAWRPTQDPARLPILLPGLAGSSEAEDGSGGGAERCPAEVSLEEALVRLAEFLSVQLGAEESFGTPSDLSKPGDVPPLLTVTGQLLALLAWIRSPRGRQALSQGTQPVSGVQHPPPAGSPLQEESPSLSPRGEAQGQQPPQLEEDQRAWQRLEQLILGQLEELKQQLEHQEEELGQLRLGVGATDSEKRVQHLTLENKALKQSLSLTRDLLLHWGPAPHTRAPQEEAEALLELRRRLQEAQDTTEALRVQLGVQEVQLQGLQGALRQLQQETEQNCRRELQQMRGQLAGLHARMASLRQGCGDLRGLVSTFTQSCQGSLSEAQGQDLGGSSGPDLHPRKHPCAVSAEARDTLQPGELRARPGWHCYHLLSRAPASLPPRLGLPSARQPRGGLQGAGVCCAVLPRGLQCLHFHLRTPNGALPFFTRDLLAPGPPQRLAVRQGPAGQGGIQVAGLTHWDVPNLESLHQMLSLGRSNRATAATAMNQRSSRSHALVTLTLRTASPSRGPGTAGTLHLVDLAGSERAWKAGTAGTSQEDRDGAQRLREARTINRSLLALGGVMAALRARRPHVPFRDSQLTRLLQPALGPGATVVLLLQISTRPEDLGETVCSLKFAERVGRVELGPARPRRAPRSGTPSSLSTDTPLSGTPCTPTPSPGSPPSPGLDSGSSSALAPPEDLPS
ncbi:kinesin-like protein KIFC2 isoform X12 [Bos taurus]|uniref:kinesin-like protein KIFC2 isoform X12 n=1 Tax=Bos taurus TaxID=9913 RepID=UPI0028CBB09F|nr:kinesin-like protein KIFC2 isoform X12 [Bos taurus]